MVNFYFSTSISIANQDLERIGVLGRKVALTFAFEMRVEIPIEEIDAGRLIGPSGRTVNMIKSYCSVRIDCRSEDV